jgi:iron(III) transport system ATP-binding protein
MTSSPPDSAKILTARGLRISHLSKAFGHTMVLDDIDLDVIQGDLVTVLGPSGSGKTTLLRLLCGFEHADTGDIELGGRLIARSNKLHAPPEKRDIGYVAQEGALFPHLCVQDNILFGLPRRIRKGRRSARAARVAELLELAGLPVQYASRYPSALSGGEQQRVALARALAPDPAVVLLDEPFSALDAGLRAETRQAVASSLKRAGATALLVTHDQDEALSMGDEVAVLQGGRLIQMASPETLYRFPANPEIARFVGEAVLVGGTVSGDAVECCFGRLPLAREARRIVGANPGGVDVLLRPEQFRIGESESDRGDGGAAQMARVERVTFYGHDARIILRLQEGLRFTAIVPGFDLPPVGQSVSFRVAGGVFAFPKAPVSQREPDNPCSKFIMS